MADGAGGFRLWKYYLDCVSADGDVCIAYVAGLRWGPLAVRYAALLESGADGARRERHTYARVPEPVVSAQGIEWRCEPLGVAATWRDAMPAHRATLLDGASGRISWELLAPRATARIERPAGAAVAGWGYAERLELTIEPWRLPFDTLYWGRFHSATDALVWIGWEGDVRLRHIVHNGELLREASFEERTLRFEPGRELHLDDTRMLHDAPVIAAVDRLPRVLRRVPPSFMAAREVKWLSQARLLAGNRAPVHGWALHETVTVRPRVASGR